MTTTIRARIAAVPASARQFLPYAVIGAGTTTLDAVLFAFIVAAMGGRTTRAPSSPPRSHTAPPRCSLMS